MRKIIKSKKAGFTDLFIFMIISFVLVVISGVLIYITNTATDEIRDNIDSMNLIGDGNQNASQVLENTLGSAVASFDALYWIASLVIFGMIIAIFIGSFMVTTKPIFFIPYIFLMIIAVIVSVPISNAYETIYNDATLHSTFQGFTGPTWILAQLPIIVAIVGFAGGIIMFARMGKREEQFTG